MRRLAIAVIVTGCGRLAFDPIGGAGGGGGGGDGAGDGA